MPGKRWVGRVALLLAAATVVSAQAQTVGGRWEILGPGPALNGNVEGINGGEVVGAVNAIATHPSNPDVLYAGGTNAGIWRTDDATAVSPTWISQTDGLGSLSIGAIEFDPTDPARQTLVAGIARTSSAGVGGLRIGMLRTTDGGIHWQPINPGGVLTNREVLGVAARGNILIAASFGAVLRSTDTGNSMINLSGAEGTGLPVGKIGDLASDPNDSAVLYVPVIDGQLSWALNQVRGQRFYDYINGLRVESVRKRLSDQRPRYWTLH